MTCPSSTEHGDLRAYRHHGCRCPRALAANTRTQKAYRLRLLAAGGGQLKVDPTGMVRRLRALACLGYGSTELAAHMGVADCRVRLLMRATWAVHAATDAQVTAAYDRLSDTPATGPYRRSIARRAAARGWLPPLAWDDDTIGDPSYTEDDARATMTRTPGSDRADAVTELREAIAAQAAAGHSIAEIADAQKVATRTVERHLADMRRGVAA